MFLYVNLIFDVGKGFRMVVCLNHALAFKFIGQRVYLHLRTCILLDQFSTSVV